MTATITVLNVLTPEEAQSVIALDDVATMRRVAGSEAASRGIGAFSMAWLKRTGAAWLFDKLDPLADGHLEDLIQLNTYTADRSGFYGRHIDGPEGGPRVTSIVVQLSNAGDYDGGILKIYPGPVLASQNIGSATIFRSHIEHEVSPITRGIRHSLVAWGRAV